MNPGIVYQYLDWTLDQESIERLSAGIWVADIETDQGGLATGLADTFHDRLTTLSPMIGMDIDRKTLGREADCNGGADVAAPPRYQGPLSCHVAPPPATVRRPRAMLLAMLSTRNR